MPASDMPPAPLPAVAIVRAELSAEPQHIGTPGFRLVTMQPPRPAHLAEREELDLALKKGTRAALELFIKRHPNSRYRAQAELKLGVLSGGEPVKD